MRREIGDKLENTHSVATRTVRASNSHAKLKLISTKQHSQKLSHPLHSVRTFSDLNDWIFCLFVELDTSRCINDFDNKTINLNIIQNSNTDYAMKCDKTTSVNK